MSEISQRLSQEDLLYQLAEEASELSHVALKLARCVKGSNPTPVSISDARDNLVEEYTDVVQVARELSLAPDEEQIAAKEKRWLERLGLTFRTKETVNDNLKACPFCGEKVKHHMMMDGCYSFICMKCGLNARFPEDSVPPQRAEISEAKKKWNTRA